MCVCGGGGGGLLIGRGIYMDKYGSCLTCVKKILHVVVANDTVKKTFIASWALITEIMVC